MDPRSDNNETFLSHWLEGRISDAELKQLVSENDFTAYQKLKHSLESLKVPEPEMDQNFASIKQKLAAKNNRKPTRVIPLYKYIAVAAVLALFFGLYQLFIFSESQQTGFGSIASVSLSDNSKVTLNAKSEIKYPSLFRYNRTLKLEGEAFFEVEKGSTFTVETSQGDIKVLGTKFNVVARPGYFEVICFEGRVSVANKSKSVLLTPRNAVRFYGKQSENWHEVALQPLWMKGESAFRNVPLYHVIDQLQHQYGYKIEYPETLKETRFTGTFTHKNLTTALQSICIPLKLEYSKTNSGKIIISE